MDAARKSFPELVRFSLVTLAIYFALQAIVVVLHEHAHSTAAWLLGYTSTPFTVVWGNPITILGWDEGVPYDQIFPSAGHAAEAVIGGVPLLMHALFVGLGFYLLRCLSSSRKFTFYAVYLFVIVNLTELVAYISSCVPSQEVAIRGALTRASGYLLGRSLLRVQCSFVSLWGYFSAEQHQGWIA